jgi:hypothetical protein
MATTAGAVTMRGYDIDIEHHTIPVYSWIT